MTDTMYGNSHHRPLLVLVLLCLAFLLLPNIAFACALGSKPTVLQAYNASDVVIIARAVSVEKLSENESMPFNGTRVTSTTMEVLKVFKGNQRVGDKMVFGQGNSIRCTWVFYEEDVGKEYLFYLDSPPDGERLWYEFGYRRSHRVKYANDDLLYLNKMNKVRGRTRISGVVDDDRALEGQRIRIIGKNGTYVARIDKDGVYELYDVPPGRYVLEPELKFGWKVDEFDLTRPPTRLETRSERRPSNRVAFKLRPRSHFGIDIKLALSNHVSGTVFDSNSKPMPSVCVALVPAGDESSLSCNSLADELGRFHIDSVEAGSYVIVVYYEIKVSRGASFPEHYYPGVLEREKAEVITIKHGENTTNLKIVIKR